VDNLDDLFASAERALKFATSKVYQAEIFAQQINSQRLLFAKNAIKTLSNIVEDSGIAVRVYDNAGRYGFAYTSSLDQIEEIERIINAAISSMKLGSPDPDFDSLPEPKPLPNVQELYDDNIANSSAEEVIDLGQQIIDAGGCNSSSVVLDGTVTMTREQRVLMNSLGTECSSDSTIGLLSASAIAKNPEGAVASNSDLSSSRQLKNLRPQWLGETVAKRACDMLGGKTIETMSVPVIFFQNAVYPLFYSILAAANADAVQKERTYLVDKKGKTIASEHLTVIDDGLVAAGFRSLPFDGEGNPKTRQKIIEKGVLRTYLYDTYTAKKHSIESTGNSMRLGYNTLPIISCNNLRITPGTRNLDTLISETKKGIFIIALHDSPDPVSGRLSGLLSEAFLIEAGEIKYPIKNAMIGIHVFDLLEGITDISSDYREEAGVLIPSIKIENARIAGAN